LIKLSDLVGRFGFYKNAYCIDTLCWLDDDCWGVETADSSELTELLTELLTALGTELLILLLELLSFRLSFPKLLQAVSENNSSAPNIIEYIFLFICFSPDIIIVYMPFISRC
jgi:hypothetical protein